MEFYFSDMNNSHTRRLHAIAARNPEQQWVPLTAVANFRLVKAHLPSGDVRVLAEALFDNAPTSYV